MDSIAYCIFCSAEILVKSYGRKKTMCCSCTHTRKLEVQKKYRQRSDGGRKYRMEFADKIREQKKQYRENNRTIFAERRRAYYLSHKEKLLAENKVRRLKNIERDKAKQSEYRKAHIKAIKRWDMEHKKEKAATKLRRHNERYGVDVAYTLEFKMRGRVRDALRGV